jgi:ATP-dependent DNA ligase
MTLAATYPLAPMESEAVDALPEGGGWLFEPKYDGFRCLAFRQGRSVRLQSKNQKPLERYFPEIAAGLRSLPIERFVLDGEIVIPEGSFETLQLRLHPAASRIKKLSQETPAALVVFDLLAEGKRRSLLAEPFSKRREALEAFFAEIEERSFLMLSRTTRSRATATRWLAGGKVEGVMAKRLDLPYRSGERAMLKIKLWKTIDCVVGGFYRKEDTGEVENLLLGLYDEAGRLNYVGRAPVYGKAKDVDGKVKPLVGGPGFTGRAPGGKNRWSGRERKPVPLKPVLVAEVSADHITGDYMRHGAKLLRWREDKAPAACTMDQIKQPNLAKRGQAHT